LVHGFVLDSIAHAWVEIDGLVYDGPLKGLYTMSDYYRIMKAIPERKFEQAKTFAKLVAETGRWGSFPQ